MTYKWKPSKSQRKAFAEKMQDPNERAKYEAQKTAKSNKRRSGSQFAYESAGGLYVPTKQQHDYCMAHWPANATTEQENARNMVLSGYSCNEKVHHDYIHIINELIRSNP